MQSKASGTSICQTKKCGSAHHSWRRSQAGGVAVEYTLVSTFAIFLAIVLLNFSAGIFRQKLETMAVKLGIDLSELDLSFFESQEES